ncbi:DUF3623 domain-containing protein [Ponticoccus sp. SC2-23]|uniref:putative photosynthetic complex assembly protein PuhE n=1 Tax=Alexandriicola marinus TaxID=2081710 RepID=UPI000FDA6ABB|nr:putative photosynthetic complex assembly protein PuhE [Alexandriicola marinus]MBM1221771.1 DUF3623 domain-containing protein [Ponticoccus sp. SC6-9]MBM1226122.1 DUF3623 domain-containing protein [Ponticoccus sp. SC6-15]MBM1230718.1 DUF3623 domain-containing protein [Ponticoccus sp. SC6-38]MBM1235441.1 DUF3623 domain-containing protein [Ponticoccus sp. SC6-45]MBM1239740.1 DUF3623 domain-containing protein [Ponticoccus sp. SC6-49]MBM1243884.1 DUF3623 domain-containing protein [Ponticoccus sp
MTSPWIAAALAVFVWWFATGVILVAVRWADRQADGRQNAAHGLALFGAVPLLALGAAGVIASLNDPGLGGVYAGFLGALAIWGWIEMAFLTGIITGPEREDCPPGLTGAARFFRAWNTVAHHEIALTLGLLAIVVVSASDTGGTALWTYLVLYVARISAKLNLFLGAPRINLEFVPARLVHLKSYFRRGPVTLMFPASITALTFAVGCFTERLIAADTVANQVHFMLLAVLSGLALLEHWLMVVPLPDAKLWRWMLPSPKTIREDEGQKDGL